MAEIIKILGNEQTFTSANSFSPTTSNVAAGYNLVRIVNTGNTSAVIVVTNASSTTQLANLTVLPYTEIIVKKQSNNTLTASSGNLLGVEIGFSQ